MKKFLLLLVVLCGLVGVGHAQDGIKSGSIKAVPGEQVDVNLTLSNPAGFTACAFQCDIVLPEGITAVADSPAATSDTHVIASNTLSDGSFRIVCYSLKNDALASGVVATFKALCGAGVTAGNYDLVIKNVEIADQNSLSKYEGIQAGDAMGDVNGDNKVNISDVTAILAVMRGVSTFDAADVNEDGVVNILDITATLALMRK